MISTKEYCTENGPRDREDCELCCEHGDMDHGICLDCGLDRTEHLAGIAYDRYKDRMKYGE